MREKNSIKEGNLSVILMTDGLGNVGSEADFRNAYLSKGRNIPIYSIMFGVFA